jgi:hypothetical protein
MTALESRVRPKVHARFGEGRSEKDCADTTSRREAQFLASQRTTVPRLPPTLLRKVKPAWVEPQFPTVELGARRSNTLAATRSDESPQWALENSELYTTGRSGSLR